MKHARKHAARGVNAIPIRQGLREILARDFTLTTAINFLLMFVYYMIFASSAFYATRSFGLSLAAGGLTAGIMVIGVLCARFISGPLLSFISCKAMLVFGLALFIAGLGLSFISESLPFYFLQRFILGFSMGLASSATATIVACVVAPAHHGLGISIFSMGTVLALGLGPLTALSVLNSMTYMRLVWLCLALLAPCLLASFFLGKISGLTHRHRPLLRLDSYIDYRVLWLSLVASIFCQGYGTTQIYMGNLCAERGLAAWGGLYFAAYALSALLTRPVTGELYDRFGGEKLMPALFLPTTAALCLLAFAHQGWMLPLAGLLMGAGFGNFQSVGQAMAIERVTRSRFAQATSTFFLLFDIGIGIGPSVYGLIVPLYGFGGMFMALAATILFALALYIFMQRRA